MHWKRPNDAALLGADADAALAWVAWARDSGIWVDSHVARWRCSNGAAAWLWLTQDGSLSCSAVAPWDSVWTMDHVPFNAFFGAVAPPDWHTKARAGLALHDWTKNAKPAPAWDSAVWCVAQMPDKKTVHLCKVARTEAGNLVSVQTELDAPPIAIASHAARRWWPLAKHPAGCASLWQSGLTEHKAYMWLVLRAKRAESVPAAPSPKARRRKAPPEAPRADLRSMMDAARKARGLPPLDDAQWEALAIELQE